MEKVNSTEIYKHIKKNKNKYNEKEHCALIIDIMTDKSKGTISAFCKEAYISDTTFHRWKNEYPLFNECYRFGLMLSLEAWEEEGRKGKYDKEFNTEIWKTQGSARYGMGKNSRVRVSIDSEANPWSQYQQLVNQAANGEFTSAELKQLMESINIGCRAFESFKLQNEVNEMKENLQKMEENSVDNSVPIKAVK